jgi:hypothetical protein
MIDQPKQVRKYELFFSSYGFLKVGFVRFVEQKEADIAIEKLNGV